MSTIKRFILNQEQLDARRLAARAANPNKAKIDELWKRRMEIAKEITKLTSDEEKYSNLLYYLAITDEKAAMVKVMTDNELGTHLINLFGPHVVTDLDQAILDETLERIGYVYEEEEIT